MLDALEMPDRFKSHLGDVSGRGVQVGIIDSGFRHRSLVPDQQILAEIPLRPGSRTEPLASELDNDRIGHGTACLTTAYRIAPGALYRSIRLFVNDLTATPQFLCEGIAAAKNSGCKIVNLSLQSDFGLWAERIYAACQDAVENGMILVAAGKGGKAVSLPAWFDNVISVSAGPQLDPFAYHCLSEGPIDVLAASGIFGRIVTGDGTFSSGRLPSYAAPVVTGIISLIIERHPSASMEDVKGILAELSSHT